MKVDATFTIVLTYAEFRVFSTLLGELSGADMKRLGLNAEVCDEMYQKNKRWGLGVKDLNASLFD